VPGDRSNVGLAVPEPGNLVNQAGLGLETSQKDASPHPSHGTCARPQPPPDCALFYAVRDDLRTLRSDSCQAPAALLILLDVKPRENPSRVLPPSERKRMN
jgi:hypothetical protein